MLSGHEGAELLPRDGEPAAQEGDEEILRIIKDPEDYEYERFRSLLGPGCDPTYFDIRSALRRLYDYERTISEVLHGFYER